MSNHILIKEDGLDSHWHGITAIDFNFCVFARYVPTNETEKACLVCMFSSVIREDIGRTGGAYRIEIYNPEEQLEALRCFEAAKHCCLDKIREAMRIQYE